MRVSERSVFGFKLAPQPLLSSSCDFQKTVALHTSGKVNYGKARLGSQWVKSQAPCHYQQQEDSEEDGNEGGNEDGVVTRMGVVMRMRVAMRMGGGDEEGGVDREYSPEQAEEDKRQGAMNEDEEGNGNPFSGLDAEEQHEMQIDPYTGGVQDVGFDENQMYGTEYNPHCNHVNQTSSPTDFTILEAYQCKNSKTHAPDHRFLCHSQHRSRSQDSRCATEDLEANEPVDDENNNEDDNAKNDGTPVKSRATCHSKADKVQGPKPTQMGYYSGAWVDVLKDAKNLYHLHIHSTDPFPEHDSKTLQDAHDRLLEAITVYEASAAVAPFEEKLYNKYATSVIPIIGDHGQNQLEYEQMICEGANALLKGGFFLQAGKDENGKTHNLSHACIMNLCKDFYYWGMLSDGLHLHKSQVNNCIDEYKNGFHQKLNFSGAAYLPVHSAMMALINKMDAHPYHGVQLGKMLRQIGDDGRLRYNWSHLLTTVTSFDVVLD
ncbi:hypothetical protein L208DRAFT_1379803 [Tricholoma matsutake]|nr:hypothetical protein L208DRAFT_1379803 [Tricholoma matsutake 945]